MDHNKRYAADLLLFLTAMIWGLGFFFQKKASETTSPYAFNAVRYLIAALVIAAFARFRFPSGREALRYTLAAGFVLYLAGTLQQVGIRTASIANTGFITSIYIVLVPFFAWGLQRRKVRPAHFLAALLSLAGLYLISTGGKGLDRISKGDMIVFAGSVFWALHILVIDKAITVCDPVVFSAGQFLIAGILHLLTWLTLGRADASGLAVSWPYTAVSGVFVLGLAFTLQAVGQKNTGETEASVILGLESVFGSLFGLVLYHERFAPVQVLGMVLIFGAVLLAILKE